MEKLKELSHLEKAKLALTAIGENPIQQSDYVKEMLERARVEALVSIAESLDKLEKKRRGF